MASVDRGVVEDVAYIGGQRRGPGGVLIADTSERTKRRTRASSVVSFSLLAADIVALTLATAVAALALDEHRWLVALGAISVPAWLVAAASYGLYSRHRLKIDYGATDDAALVLRLLAIGGWIALAGAWLLGLRPPVGALVVFWGLASVLLTAARAIALAGCRRMFPSERVIVLGAGAAGSAFVRRAGRSHACRIDVVGLVDTDPGATHDDAGAPDLGPLERLPGLVRLLDVERVVIVSPEMRREDILAVVDSLRELDVQVDVRARLLDFLSGTSVHVVAGEPLVGFPHARLSRSSRIAKRTFDVLLSGAGLLLAIPLLVPIAILIKLTSPGPVFFRQVRMGASDRTFRIYKFRTMAVDAEERKRNVAHLNRHALEGGDPRLFKIVDDPRATRIGSFLRDHFLDEIPQLLNVLKGEMTIVGPRPLVLDEDEHIRGWARDRLDLRPGITGLWQVLGHSSISFEQMIQLDYVYVSTWSLRSDISLLLRTVPVVLKGASRGV